MQFAPNPPDPDLYDLGIIIVNYNTQNLVEECLESIYRHLLGKLSFEIIVVDNNSQDGSPDFLRSYSEGKPELKLVFSSKNQGFAKGNNLGLEKVRSRYILLLNSDAFLIDGSLVQAMDFLDSNPNVFGCGCRLLNRDGTVGVSYGDFPKIFTVLREISRNRFNSLRARTPTPGEAGHTIDSPCGAFFLINGKLLHQVGPMDDGFFMYFEETDLALRAKKAGYGMHYLPHVNAVHLGGGSSSGHAVGPLTEVFYRSWRRYLLKHSGNIQSCLMKWTLSVFFKLKFVICLLRKRKAHAAYFSGHARAVAAAWNDREIKNMAEGPIPGN